MSALRRAIMLLTLTTAAACSASDHGPTGFRATMAECGVPAAMGVGISLEERENPPACALPSVEQVARSCAFHDFVRAPDYQPAAYDEFGHLVEGSEPPNYAIADLECGFIDARRNKAVCTFSLETPDMTGGPVSTSATFDHSFWADHGPTHHIYGTMWSAVETCLPRG